MAGGYQLRTAKVNAEWVKKFLGGRPARMGRATLETLAIIAYRQPITKAEIEAIRGVDVDGVITTLLERNLIRAVARKDVPGRPFLYGTTAEFLQLFNLNDLTICRRSRKRKKSRCRRFPATTIPLEQRARRKLSGNRDGTAAKNYRARGIGFAPGGGALDRRGADHGQRHGDRKLGSQADPFKDSIKVDGKRIKTAAAPLYYALHKPPGVITTLNDPQHRPDITPLCRARSGEKKRVFPVGRLDYNTTGLLLLTNDGDLAHAHCPSPVWYSQSSIR